MTTRSVALYERVSSRQQDHKAQHPDLERWAKAQADPVRWYADKKSGRTMDRPGWNRLWSDVEAGKIKTIAVWRLDRLGRTAKGLTALFDDLRFRKINLVSLKDGVDLSTPAGRLIAGVLANVAEYEGEVLLERILAGQATARAEGTKWGGSKKGRLLTVTKEQVEAIHRLNALGKKKTAIARATGLSRPTIYRLLRKNTP